MYYLFFPSFISQFPNFLLYFIFLYMGSMYITVHIMEACNKDYYYYIIINPLYMFVGYFCQFIMPKGDRYFTVISFMSVMASQIPSISNIQRLVFQRKHKVSVSSALCEGGSPLKGTVMHEAFPCHDVIMSLTYITILNLSNMMPLNLPFHIPHTCAWFVVLCFVMVISYKLTIRVINFTDIFQSCVIATRQSNNCPNRPVSQLPALLATCRELSGDYNRLLNVLYVFDKNMS